MRRTKNNVNQEAYDRARHGFARTDVGLTGE